jgi:hypothetical protein
LQLRPAVKEEVEIAGGEEEGEKKEGAEDEEWTLI